MRTSTKCQRLLKKAEKQPSVLTGRERSKLTEGSKKVSGKACFSILHPKSLPDEGWKPLPFYGSFPDNKAFFQRMRDSDNYIYGFGPSARERA